MDKCVIFTAKKSLYCYNPEISKHEIIATIENNPCLDIIRGSANSFQVPVKIMLSVVWYYPMTQTLIIIWICLEFIEILGDERIIYAMCCI